MPRPPTPTVSAAEIGQSSKLQPSRRLTSISEAGRGTTTAQAERHALLLSEYTADILSDAIKQYNDADADMAKVTHDVRCDVIEHHSSSVPLHHKIICLCISALPHSQQCLERSHRVLGVEVANHRPTREKHSDVLLPRPSRQGWRHSHVAVRTFYSLTSIGTTSKVSWAKMMSD